MKKKLKEILSISLILIILGLTAYFFIYWGINSELTAMQIFLKKWYIIVFIFLVGIASMWIDESNNKI